MTDLMKSVSKEEFDAFLKAYPRELKADSYMAAEPPFVTYNDFERAPYWPDSVVASSVGGVSGFQVLVDINSPVPDSGKRETEEPLLDNNGAELHEGDRVSVHWGGSFSDGAFTPNIREETIIIRNRGTKYERWSFESCHNHARGFDMEKLA